MLIIHVYYATYNTHTIYRQYIWHTMRLHYRRIKEKNNNKQMCLGNSTSLICSWEHGILLSTGNCTVDRRWKQIITQGRVGSFAFLSHPRRRDGCRLPWAFPGLCSWFIYFGPIAFWNPLSSTHFWHNPVKMWRFITQRSKQAADTSETVRDQEALTPALQRKPSTILARLKYFRLWQFHLNIKI